MRRAFLACVLLAVVALSMSLVVFRGSAGDRQAAPGELELVGHEPLLARGMNSALALHGDYVYVGSRSDGSHDHGGILIADISDPSKPEVIGEIGRARRPRRATPACGVHPRLAAQRGHGGSRTELRVGESRDVELPDRP